MIGKVNEISFFDKGLMLSDFIVTRSCFYLFVEVKLVVESCLFEQDCFGATESFSVVLKGQIVLKFIFKLLTPLDKAFCLGISTHFFLYLLVTSVRKLGFPVFHVDLSCQLLLSNFSEETS